MRFCNALLTAACFVLLLALPLTAQTFDTSITGTVTDSSGAVLPGATVTVTSPSTGLTKTAVSGASGQYSVTYLTPGSYTVTIAATGFGSKVQKGLELQINQQAKFDTSLSISSQGQVVEITSQQPLIQAEDASLGAVIDSDRAVNLPLNGRRFNDLAILTPGVVVSNPDDHSSSTNGSTISSNGGRNIWGQINVDGVTMVNNRHAYVNAYPSVDAIDEFKVLTGNYSAEYGGGSGSIVNVQLKTGTNQFHGTVFEFIRNQAVDARNLFRVAPLAKNVLKQNQFGGTVGGPIFKDRTFFFASYEGLRSISETPSTANVLTAAQRNGDFSALTTPLRNPFTGGTYANNQIPVNAVAQNIVNTYMPLPNTTGSTNYSGASSGNLSVDQGILRLDHKFNDANQVFLHYIYADRNFPVTNINPNFHFTGTYPIHNVAFQYVHVFSPHIVNELRLGTDLEHVKQLSVRANTNFTAASIGINGFLVGGPNGRVLTPAEEGFPTLSISGYINVGDGTAASNLDDSRTYQLADNLTWTRGKHTIVFGADIRHVQDNATTNNTPYGSESFTGSITGNAAADFILGYPATSITPEGVPISKLRQWRTGAYVQDDWKLTPKLTLNIGLRHDLWVPPVDVNNVSRTLDFSGPTPVFTPAPGARLNNIWSVSDKDFEPRVGFAYSIDPTTVIRGAYGISFFGGQFDNINILQLNPPTAGSLTISNTTTNPIATISTPVPAALYPANPFYNATTLNASRTHPDLYLQTTNLAVSKQFYSNVLDITYVHVKGTHEDSSLTYFNSPQPGPGAIQARRPYPTFARIRMLDFSGASGYNALQVHFEHRMTHSLSFTGVYSWSHTIDNQGADVNGGGCECQNPRVIHEWANGLTDQRHTLTVGYVWKLPKLSDNQNAIARAFLNGWGLNGIAQVASGTPLFITQSTDAQNTDNGWERPNLVIGVNPRLNNRSVNGWFNTAAFTTSTYLTGYGTTPRNPFVGPATRNTNLALARNFTMPYNEGHHLELRLEAFNALNTPQFSNPGTSQGSSTFGKITSTKIDNRELQLGVKYLF
ncbi:TonB-dependent receptor [Granulicella sibirica]|uniref:Oar protein n=1 Tax=Granulicella sibirica TaxID=2479048 RepID=A0A4Q0T3V3_9BACT|nr:TonB-dependent receptor [Granulicella sibirica]RXH58303.1 Oar protein [Granulicella sibirica]